MAPARAPCRGRKPLRAPVVKEQTHKCRDPCRIPEPGSPAEAGVVGSLPVRLRPGERLSLLEPLQPLQLSALTPLGAAPAQSPEGGALPGRGAGALAESVGCAQPSAVPRSSLPEAPGSRMGNHVGKRELGAEKATKDAAGPGGDGHGGRRAARELSREASEDNEVFGQADAGPDNVGPSPGSAVTDSTRTAAPKNAWPGASPADPRGRPHLIRLFSRDAPGREDNTFKDRPSESDELQTIQEDSTAAPEGPSVMASQKRPSQRHGSKYLASASTMDHARHGFLPRHRDTGFLDSLGRFFSGDRGVPKRGSGKDTHHAARTTHYGSLPQKSQHGRAQDENPVVHFFKNIVTPRTPPPSQGKGRGLSLSRFSWGAEGQKPGFGYGGRASSAHKGLKAHDAQGALSRIFKLGGRDSRSGSPMARR
ncbi:myelin basic protein [Talpa occidentalis]|uniref:myelin basic protein n=1 Tax=Talpa occidentalis TaxID=50954 RepID=UPI00188DD458|nr:myelin basic protein [Talpa occidentalis]